MSEPTTGDVELDTEVTTTETDSVVDGVETHTVDTKFFNQHDGTTGRLPGQYLDQIEQQQAEILRAKAEGREPDLENPGATAGTPLVTEDALADNSVTKRDVLDPDAPVSAQPVQTLPVDQTGNLPEDASPAVSTTPDPADVKADANSQPPSVTGVPASVGTFNPTTPMVDESPETPVVDEPEVPVIDSDATVTPSTVSVDSSDVVPPTGA